MNPLVNSLIGPITNLLGEFIEDKDKANEIAYKIASQAHEIAKGQMEINKIEAASPSLFKSGWRPAIAWLGVLNIAWESIGITIASLAGIDPVILESTRNPQLTSIVMALLGIGGMRSFEKFKGVSK